MTRTVITTNVHINDETEFEANKVTNFVALKIGDHADLFIMTAEQAAKLADAAAEAFAILTRMEGGGNSETDQMLKAGKDWINAIYGDQKPTDFNATLRWNVEDWKVVMARHGSFVPDQSDVDKFQAKFAKSYLRGLK